MYNITYNTVLEFGVHEGLVRQAYKDVAGVWTWSMGLTDACGHLVERYKDKPQEISKCLEIFIWALEGNYARKVREVFSGITLSEAQFAAALSFHWNTGAIGTATWVKEWKAGNIDGARAAILNWRYATVKGKKQEIGALKDRRIAERDLFFDGKWLNDGSTIIEYTKLKSDYTVDWHSGVRVDVSAILYDLLDVEPPAKETEVVAKEDVAPVVDEVIEDIPDDEVPPNGDASEDNWIDILPPEAGWEWIEAPELDEDEFLEPPEGEVPQYKEPASAGCLWPSIVVGAIIGAGCLIWAVFLN